MDFCVACVPLHDVGLAGLQAGKVVAEVQRQRAVRVTGRFESLDNGSP